MGMKDNVFKELLDSGGVEALEDGVEDSIVFVVGLTYLRNITAVIS